MLSWLDATLATLGERFMRAWGRVDRSYRRPLSRLALRLKFAFYPLLALAALGWLAWDWTHERSLNAAENAIFDRIVNWRPVEPSPSGRVVVVEIDECSIEHFRAHGEGGWPWSRQRHADLLDRLDRAGVLAVGYDVLLTDPSRNDPEGDGSLEAMAEGGAGRFVFAAARMHPDYDPGSPIRASQTPAAFPLTRDPQDDPQVALLLPYGAAMAGNSAIVNVTRNEDGVMRDIPVYEAAGDWGLPSLPLRLALIAARGSPKRVTPVVRPNWREDSRLPHISAADLLADRPVCRDAKTRVPPLKDSVVLVGYTASGLNDAKPTPVDPVMPGVEVLAEATEALIVGSAIRVPAAWLKYLLAALLTAVTAFAFFRGEPHNDIDAIFVATNLLLLVASFIGLSFFGYFFDIFAAVGFISLVFGLCRIYAKIQRGRAVGNSDYLPDFDPAKDRWLAVARLHFVPDAHLDARSVVRRRREYRRRLRRFLYAGSDAVMLEGIVEEKTWLHDALSDVSVLMWHGDSDAAARGAAMNDLARLERYLAEQDARLPDDGTVRLAFASAAIAHGPDSADGKVGIQLHELIGRVLATATAPPLAKRSISKLDDTPAGEH
jgi:CHASE2 domain-containing sensor protein